MDTCKNMLALVELGLYNCVEMRLHCPLDFILVRIRLLLRTMLPIGRYCTNFTCQLCALTNIAARRMPGEKVERLSPV